MFPVNMSGARLNGFSVRNAIEQMVDSMRAIDEVFLIIGRTGAGKSSLINLIHNYFRGHTLENLEAVVPTKHFTSQMEHSEADIDNPGTSKTQKPNHYVYSSKSFGKTFAFIDTPGLADTRGPEQDAQNVRAILDVCLAQEKLKGIWFVVNGAEPRFDSLMKQVAVTFRANLPDGCLGGLKIIINRAEYGQHNYPLDMLCRHLLGRTADENQVFLVNLNAWAYDQIDLRSNIRLARKVREDLEDAKTELTKLLQEDIYPRSLALEGFKMMAELRVKSMGQVSALNSFLESLIQSVDALQSHTAYITTKRSVPTPNMNMNCLVCLHTCHEECHQMGVFGFKIESCEVFKKSRNCLSCESHCRKSNHFRSHVKFIIESETNDKFMKQLWTGSGKTRDASKPKGELIKEDFSLLLSEYQRSCNEIKDILIRIYKICSGFDVVGFWNPVKDAVDAKLTKINNAEAKLNFLDLTSQLTHDLYAMQVIESVAVVDLEEVVDVAWLA